MMLMFTIMWYEKMLMFKIMLIWDEMMLMLIIPLRWDDVDDVIVKMYVVYVHEGCSD